MTHEELYDILANVQAAIAGRWYNTAVCILEEVQDELKLLATYKQHEHESKAHP